MCIALVTDTQCVCFFARRFMWIARKSSKKREWQRNSTKTATSRDMQLVGSTRQISVDEMQAAKKQ